MCLMYSTLSELKPSVGPAAAIGAVSSDIADRHASQSLLIELILTFASQRSPRSGRWKSSEATSRFLPGGWRYLWSFRSPERSSDDGSAARGFLEGRGFG